MLRDRPGMTGRRIETCCFPWGTAVVQAPPNKGCAPLYENGELWCCVGRPYFVGWSPDLDEPTAMMRAVRERWKQNNIKALAESLSGMYVIARCMDDSVEILTDQMGFRPVYSGEDHDQRLGAIGTHVEAVAHVSSRLTDYDPTSFAELLLHQQISFPHTSRHGVRELLPASITRVESTQDRPQTSTTSLWVPEEPATAAITEVDLVDRLTAALRGAASDVTRGLRRPACTLSGGWDSRAMLVVLQECCEIESITFQTQSNRESETARKVAKAAGVAHHVVQRSVDFYEDVLERSIDLLGTELRANAHGLCLVDSALHNAFDLIIGGQLCDTFLKDHFAVSGSRSVRQQSSRDGIAQIIRPELHDAIRERRERWRGVIAAFRPGTAVEWQCFWPASRQNDAGHNLGNSRLYASDSLFMHRDIVNYAAEFPVDWSTRTTVTKRAFLNLYGALANVPIAQTAQLPAAPETMAWPRHIARRLRGRLWRYLRRGARESSDWNDVQTSWVNWQSLQRSSPRWSVMRRKVLEQSQLDVLRSVLTESPERIIEEFQPSIGAMGNLIVMQIAQQLRRTHMDRTSLQPFPDHDLQTA